MDKVIIIDGVDVSECEYFQEDGGENTCRAEEDYTGTVVCCSACDNCYYKQLQRAKAEIKELKKELEKHKSKIGHLLSPLTDSDFQDKLKKLEQENERLKNSLKICQGLCKTLEEAKANEHNHWFNRCCEINTECDKYRQAYLYPIFIIWKMKL